jgi:hypothetical protein
LSSLSISAVGKSGKEKASSPTLTTSTSSPTAGLGLGGGARQTNVFSLVERFTFKPSSSELAAAAAAASQGGGNVGIPPRMPPEIQYWAGVVMRNACRKDDNRGGIRQCANSAWFLFIYSLWV